LLYDHVATLTATVATWQIPCFFCSVGLTNVLRSPAVSFSLLAQCGLALHRIDS
jgi:hypothetical protein